MARRFIRVLKITIGKREHKQFGKFLRVRRLIFRALHSSRLMGPQDYLSGGYEEHAD